MVGGCSSADLHWGHLLTPCPGSPAKWVTFWAVFFLSCCWGKKLILLLGNSRFEAAFVEGGLRTPLPGNSMTGCILWRVVCEGWAHPCWETPWQVTDWPRFGARNFYCCWEPAGKLHGKLHFVEGGLHKPLLGKSMASYSLAPF